MIFLCVILVKGRVKEKSDLKMMNLSKRTEPTAIVIALSTEQEEVQPK